MAELAGRYRFDVAPDSIFNLYHFTDWHLLNKACAEDKIDERIDQVLKDPCCAVACTGDLLECIDYNDLRFAPGAFPDGVRVRDLADYGHYSFNYLLTKLMPIRHKIIGFGLGNHEEVLFRKMHSYHLWTDFLQGVGRHPARMIDSNTRKQDVILKREWERVHPASQAWQPPAADLGADIGFFDLVFRVGRKEYEVRVATHHGHGWAKTPGAMQNMIANFLNYVEADIMLTGHLHSASQLEQNTIGVDTTMTSLTSRSSLGIIGSTYLKTYAKGISTYGGRIGSRPSTLGNPIIGINPEMRRFDVSW